MKFTLLTALLGSSVKGYEHIVLNDATAEGLSQGEYKSCLQDAYSGDYLVDWASESVDRRAVFDFQPQEDGCYVLEEWHPGMDNQCNRFSSMVRLDVDYCKGKSAYAYVDQAQNGGRWNILGALPFYRGWLGRVNVSSDQAHACREGGGCFWTADAMRVTKVSNLDVDCVAPDTMPEAEVNVAVAAMQRSDAEVLLEQAGSATIDLEVAPVLLDEASLTLPHGWKVEALDASPLQCARQGWGQRFAFLDPKESADAALEFEFAPEADGCYLVEEFHPADVCNKPLSPEVQVKLSYCKGKDVTLSVDQSTGGNRWNVLALLPYYKGWAGRVSVKHPQGGAGVATADAFRITKIAKSCAGARAKLGQYAVLSQQSVSRTLDEKDAEVQGQKLPSCDASALLGAAHTVEGSKGSAKFAFLPETTGCYRVDEYHPISEGQCQLSSAELTIDYCLGGTADASVDLSAGGKQWNPVAYLPFYAGEPGAVTSRGVDGLWTADAFRFSKVSDSCQNVPDASLLSVRLTGVDLKEPEFQGGGHLTKHTDMRLAFHEAITKYARLAEESVKLLGLRQGSIIIDFEFSGSEAETAAGKLQSSFADGVLSQALCAVATVGQDPAPKCDAELLQVTHASSPTAERAQRTGNRALVIGLSVAGSVLLLGAVVAGVLVYRRRQASSAKPDAPLELEAPGLVMKDTKDDDADTASTGTPKVSSEVQTDVSGEISEVGSLASREATVEEIAETSATLQEAV